MQDAQPFQLLYITDPLDPWSYGFTPEISRIKKEYQDVLDFRMVLGGIRTENKQVLDEPSKDDIAHQWHQVNARTGQEFNYALFQQEGFVYNSEPVCRALVVVRQLKPGREFAAFQTLQEAFFQRSLDITDPNQASALLAELGIREENFLAAFGSREVREQTGQDFAYAAQLGVKQFPSLYLQTGQEVHAISRGYRTFDNMQPIITRVIHQVRGR
ncbi:DsbA family protein [soil metagenome]